MTDDFQVYRENMEALDKACALARVTAERAQIMFRRLRRQRAEQDKRIAELNDHLDNAEHQLELVIKHLGHLYPDRPLKPAGLAVVAEKELSEARARIAEFREKQLRCTAANNHKAAKLKRTNERIAELEEALKTYWYR